MIPTASLTSREEMVIEDRNGDEGDMDMNPPPNNNNNTNNQNNTNQNNTNNNGNIHEEELNNNPTSATTQSSFSSTQLNQISPDLADL